MKIRDRIKEIREVKASDILPNPHNWRLHPEEQENAMRGAFAEIGNIDVLKCIETDDGLMLVDGHLRDKILGDQVVKVAVLDLDKDEAKKALAIFDPLSMAAKADQEKLDAILADCEFEAKAIEELLNSLDLTSLGVGGGVGGQTDPDDVPEVPDEPTTMPGDLWILGDHRLLCGDSTNPEDVSLVLDAMPDLQIVDPPFDLDYFDWPLQGMPKIVMVWQRGVQAIKWEAAVLANDYGCHELVFTGGVRGWPADWFPCTTHDVVRMWRSPEAMKKFDQVVLRQSGCRTVKDGTRPFSVQEHAGGVLTGYGGMSWGKALVSMEIAMAYILPGEVVYDSCAGSGTSLIAAEKHGRIWRGVENQPKWCDLIVQRFREQIGKEPQHIDRKEVASYIAGKAGAVTPAAPDTHS